MPKLIDPEKLKKKIRDDMDIDGVNYARVKMHIDEAEGVVIQKWIPVTERLPNIDDDVLMYFADDGNMTAGFLVDVGEDTSMWSAYSDGGYYTDCDYVPTHWMPLPEPPKEVE